jgi:hypothetical protein
MDDPAGKCMDGPSAGCINGLGGGCMVGPAGGCMLYVRDFFELANKIKFLLIL